jgi:hypothetical protein
MEWNILVSDEDEVIKYFICPKNSITHRGINQELRWVVSLSWIPLEWKESSRLVNVCLRLWHPERVLTPRMSLRCKHSSREIVLAVDEERKQ